MREPQQKVIRALASLLPSAGFTVLGLRPAAGWIDIEAGDKVHHLRFSDTALAVYSKSSTSHVRWTFGIKTSPEKATAILLLTDLQEGLARYEARTDGMWIFDRGFRPGAPWAED